MTMPLLAPQPRRVSFADGFFQPSPEELVLIDNFIRGGELPSCISLAGEGAPGNGEKAGSYRLDIGAGGIGIFSHDEAGTFYAVQTLRQLADRKMNGRLSFCRIEDFPDFEVRAVLYDISRDRVPGMDTLKKLIDSFAHWKYNQFQLYTEHTFAYPEHRSVWKDASPFRPEEIRELNEYCRERFIELVPNQNSFGHMERWLKHDGYKHLAESPEGFTDNEGVFHEDSSTLAPAVPETLDFLDGLYTELLPCFDSDMLNVGGDEPWELGKGKTRELCESRGLDRVYLDYLLSIRGIAARHGKRIQIYGDIIMKYPELIKELPKDLILVNWGYEANHPFEEECRKIAASGIPFYVCTGVSSWNSIGGRWSNTFRNILSGADSALRYGASGFVVSEWGDNGHLQQLSAGLPGFLLGACAAWNKEAAEQFEPVDHTARYIFGGDRRLAEASALIQDVWECSKVALHNVSLPAVMILDPRYPYYREDYPKFRGYGFADELKLLDKADSLLGPADESELRDELSFSSGLLRHGCMLGKYLLAGESLTLAGIPEPARAELAADLAPLIDEYRRLWNKTSREGGLSDSVGRLEELMRLYRSGNPAAEPQR